MDSSHALSKMPLTSATTDATTPNKRTTMTGKSDARVTTPKALAQFSSSSSSSSPSAARLPVSFSSSLSSSPLDATPTPRARTRGTVTGPVVTAPQSHARPRISRTSTDATKRMYMVRASVIGTEAAAAHTPHIAQVCQAKCNYKHRR